MTAADSEHAVGTRADLAEVLACTPPGGPRSVTRLGRSPGANDAIDEVLHGKVTARVVLEP